MHEIKNTDSAPQTALLQAYKVYLTESFIVVRQVTVESNILLNAQQYEQKQSDFAQGFVGVWQVVKVSKTCSHTSVTAALCCPWC